MLTLQSLQHQEPKAVHIFGLLQSSGPSECRMSDVLPVPRGLHKVTTVGLLVPFLWIFSSCFTTLSTTASLSRNGLWLSSLHQRQYSQNALLPSAARTPMGAKTSEFAFPLPDGRRAGLALQKTGWGQLQRRRRRRRRGRRSNRRRRRRNRSRSRSSYKRNTMHERFAFHGRVA